MESFIDCDESYELFLRVKDAFTVPLVVCGNKCDLEEVRQVTTDEGKQFAASKGATFFETSAKVQENNHFYLFYLTTFLTLFLSFGIIHISHSVQNRINIEEAFFECARLVEASRVHKFEKKEKSCTTM